jgi:O-antigen ligase
MTARLKPVLALILVWPLVAGLGVVLAANTKLGLLLAVVAATIAFAVLASGDLRVPRMVLAVLLWGVLFANKSFATLGIGNLYVMDGLLGLTVLGVVVHPRTRARLVAARFPIALLSLFLLLGAVNLARGHAWGIDAAKDSVLNFYAIAAILPAALFPSAEKALGFLRTCLPALVVGAVFLSLSATGISVPFGFTPGTAGAAIAAGFLFVVLTPRRISPSGATAAAVLGVGVALSLSRSVWLGSVLAGVVILLISIEKQRRVLSALGATAVTALAVGVLLTFQGSNLPAIFSVKVSSIFFHESSATAAIGVDPVANSYWRLKVWHQTWDTRIGHNLLVGEGFGRPAVAATSLGNVLHVTDSRVQVHNGYLSYLMREGLVGLLAFLAVAGGALVRAIHNARHSADKMQRTFALTLVGALCVYLVDLGLGVIIEGPMGGIPFWFLVGLAYVLPRAPKSTLAGAAT